MVRKLSGFTGLGCLAGARLAVNDFRSYSGCIGLRAAVAEMLQLGAHGASSTGIADPGRVHRVNFFDPQVLVTGGHRASVAAVLRGEADCASIDCVTWALLEAEHFEASDGSSAAPSGAMDMAALRVVGETPSAPAPPFVVPVALGATCSTPMCNPDPEPMPPLQPAGAGAGAAAEMLFNALVDALPTSSSHEALRLQRIVRADADEYRNEFARLNALASHVAIDDRWSECHAEAPARPAEQSQFVARLDLCGYVFDPAAALQLPEGSPACHARTMIDRGFLCQWAFNHEEASRCFRQAVDTMLRDRQSLSSSGGSREGVSRATGVLLLLARWATANALCPNYNKEVLTAEEMATARGCHATAAAQLASELDPATATATTPVEGEGGADGGVTALLQLCQLLIEAQRIRLEPADDDLGAGTFAHRARGYSAALAAIHRRADAQRGPGSAELTALLAESMMQLHPWMLWRDGTVALSKEIQKVIEDGLCFLYLCSFFSESGTF